MVRTVIYMCSAKTMCPLCDLSITQLSVVHSVIVLRYTALYDNSSIVIRNCFLIGEI